ncbi:hypothetical protein ACFWIA_17745 [Streptomyces sp. NPDC127068]|uniref:hypothetical protein n=1 Tax=Streptomyces sp. NPDC127068 TaxID=3347127 RepID=UPI00366999D4
MIELTDPQLVEQDLVLTPADALRDVPAEGDPVDPPLAGRVRLGGPHALRLTPDELAADPALARYAEDRAALYDHYLVRLSLTFAPEPRSPRLEFAHVGLSLSSTAFAPQPVAHSMDPVRLTDAVQVQRVRRIGPQLSLLGADASLGEVGRTVTFTRNRPLVQALDLGGSAPAWEFRRTEATELTGSYPLSLVVRSGAGAVTELGCTVTAGVKAPLLRRYHRVLPDPLRLHTVL